MTIEEKIKGINITPSSSMLKPLCSGTAIDIETFWKDVVEPLLPDYKTMKANQVEASRLNFFPSSTI